MLYCADNIGFIIIVYRFSGRCQVRYDLHEINDGGGFAPVQRAHRVQNVGDQNADRFAGEKSRWLPNHDPA